MSDQQESLVDEDARRLFERSWVCQKPANLRQYLPSQQDRRYLATLEELVHVDLELAWQKWASHQHRDRPDLLETYVDAYPELAETAIRSRLARHEYQVRHAAGDSVLASDYTTRFPDLFSSEEDFRGALQEFSLDPPSTFSLPSCDSTVDPETAKRLAQRKVSPVGSRVGDFEIKQELGRGGMGVVYRARDAKLNRDIALKMILGGAHVSTGQLERFLTEARAVAQLQHPNIVQVFEIGEHGGLPFLAMEYVAGLTLANQLARKPLPPADAARLLETLARTVQHAHDHRILHRDLKPANILLTPEGVPKISDFGLAKQLEEDSAATKTGTVLGTPSYMSPEQAQGATKEVGPASDQYALGALMYEILTGRPPFLAADPLETILEVIHKEPVPPKQLQSKLPDDLNTICLKALQKDPGKRYASVTDLAEDLRRFSAGEPIMARPVRRLERLRRWCTRNPLVASLTTASVLLLLAITSISIWAAYSLSVKNSAIESQNRQIKEQNAAITREKEVADQRAEMAMGAYQTLITEVQNTIADTPQTEQLKINLMRAVADGMERLSNEMGEETPADPTLAAALMKMANELHRLGQSDQALRLHQRVYDLVRPRPAFKNGSDASRFNVARALWNLAVMDEELQRDMQASLAHNVDALSVLQDIQDHPNSGVDGELAPWLTAYLVAEAQLRVGVSLMRLGNSAEATQHYLRALELRQGLLDRLDSDPDMSKLPPRQKTEIRQSVATAHLAVGETLARLGHFAEASTHFQDAVRIRESVYQAQRDDVTAQQYMGRAAGMWGEFLTRNGKLAEARERYALSCQLAEQVAEANKQNTEYQRDLGVALYRRGVLLQMCQDPAAAEVFQRCRAIRQELVDVSSANEKFRRELMLVLAHTDQFAEAAQLAREFRQMESPDNEVLIDVARALSQCSRHPEAADDATDYHDQALAALEAAVQGGYSDRLLLEQEPDLQPLRDDKKFRQLVSRLQQTDGSAAGD